MSKNIKTAQKKWVAILIFPWACILISIILETLSLDILKVKSGSVELEIVNIISIILTGLFLIGLFILTPIAVVILIRASNRQ